MKKTIKKLACAALCAVILFCMTVPAFALTGSENHTHVAYGFGVRVTCASSVSSSEGKSELALSFEPGVSHMPESDYRSIAKVVAHYPDGTTGTSTANQPGMSATATYDINNATLKKIVHTFYVNSESTYGLVHTKTFS
jgi:hypothetical protein